MGGMMAKSDKSEVNYSKGMAASHCGQWRPTDQHYCKHFREPAACTEVKGQIDRYYWCKRFKRVDMK